MLALTVSALLAVTGCSGTDGIVIPDGEPGNASAQVTMVQSPLPEAQGATIDAGVAEGPDAGAWVPPSADPLPPSPPTPGIAPPAPATLEALHAGCVALVNGYRASVGRPALIRAQGAEACADAQASFDAHNGTAHSGYRRCAEQAQNECPDWPGANVSQALASCLQTMWNGGPSGSHFRNMASTQISYVACGFYQAPNGRYWLVQNFR